VSLKGEYRQESKQEDENVYRSEFRYGSFYRTIPLPVEVDQTQAKAELKDGILTLTLPKVTPDRNKAVKINLASSTAAPVDAAATEAEAAAV
jgi:HSP20 family protein